MFVPQLMLSLKINFYAYFKIPNSTFAGIPNKSYLFPVFLIILLKRRKTIQIIIKKEFRVHSIKTFKTAHYCD